MFLKNFNASPALIRKIVDRAKEIYISIVNVICDSPHARLMRLNCV